MQLSEANSLNGGLTHLEIMNLENNLKNMFLEQLKQRKVNRNGL